MIQWRNTDKGYYKSSWAFAYYAAGRLSRIEGPSRDTAPDGYLNPAFDVTYTFGYNGSDTVPWNYSIQFHGLNVKDEPTEYNVLRYSGGGLASDTLHGTTEYGPYVEISDFSAYTDKTYRIATHSGQEDTVYFDHGNMVTDSVMGITGNGKRNAIGWQTRTYGTDQNPLYIPAFTSPRLAFYFDFYQDFGSPNVVKTYKFIDEKLLLETWNYTWTKDEKGRINGGTAVGGLDGKVQDQVLFSYKK